MAPPWWDWVKMKVSGRHCFSCTRRGIADRLHWSSVTTSLSFSVRVKEEGRANGNLKENSRSVALRLHFLLCAVGLPCESTSKTNRGSENLSSQPGDGGGGEQGVPRRGHLVQGGEGQTGVISTRALRANCKQSIHILWLHSSFRRSQTIQQPNNEWSSVESLGMMALYNLHCFSSLSRVDSFVRVPLKLGDLTELHQLSLSDPSQDTAELLSVSYLGALALPRVVLLVDGALQQGVDVQVPVCHLKTNILLFLKVHLFPLISILQ